MLYNRLNDASNGFSLPAYPVLFLILDYIIDKDEVHSPHALQLVPDCCRDTVKDRRISEWNQTGFGIFHLPWIDLSEINNSSTPKPYHLLGGCRLGLRRRLQDLLSHYAALLRGLTAVVPIMTSSVSFRELWRKLGMMD